MDNGFDPALVQMYVDRCFDLGMRSQAGEDVAERIEGTVDEAFAHFEAKTKGAPLEYQRSFAGQLRRFAGLLGQATPQQAKILMDAHVCATIRLSQA